MDWSHRHIVSQCIARSGYRADTPGRCIDCRGEIHVGEEISTDRRGSWHRVCECLDCAHDSRGRCDRHWMCARP
jgi:hypothetical protein